MATFTTSEVLRDEACAIHGSDAVPPGPEGKALYAALNRLQSTALCLSGGGIRSAAFSLGVIQALATHPRSADRGRARSKEDSLLSRFHYLSTVSGGGYAGGWLSAWLTHAYSKSGDWSAVWESIAGNRGTPEEEPPQFSWLRSYSNYLTPKLGIASADAWTTVALSVRNLILNWLVILPALCAALILLKLVASAVAWVSQFDPRTCTGEYGFGQVFAVLRGGRRPRPGISRWCSPPAIGPRGSTRCDGEAVAPRRPISCAGACPRGRGRRPAHDGRRHALRGTSCPERSALGRRAVLERAGRPRRRGSGPLCRDVAGCPGEPPARPTGRRRAQTRRYRRRHPRSRRLDRLRRGLRHDRRPGRVCILSRHPRRGGVASQAKGDSASRLRATLCHGRPALRGNDLRRPDQLPGWG